MKTNETTWALIVSAVLHPLLMMTYGIIILFWITDFAFIFRGQFLRFFIPVVLFSCAIPASTIFSLKQLGFVSDYDVTTREERPLPYLIVLISYIVLFYYFYKPGGVHIWFLAVLIAPISMMILGSLINVFWKISAHMAGIGCLVGSILSVSYNIKHINPYLLFIILFILAGVLGVSRLILKRHSPGQVYAGFILGLVISYICVWIGGNFTYLYHQILKII